MLPPESVLFIGVKSSEGKLVQRRSYHPHLDHFSPMFAAMSGTKREKRGTGPEHSGVLRRERVRASPDALQRPTARGPVFLPASMARYGIFRHAPGIFFNPARNRPRLPGSPPPSPAPETPAAGGVLFFVPERVENLQPGDAGEIMIVPGHESCIERESRCRNHCIGK